jgi:hypothetical protein
MADSDRAQPITPLNAVLSPEEILRPEEIQEIREKATRRWRAEAKARKRKLPRWDPDSPWHPFKDIFAAALKACKDLSTNDLEVILGRGRVWITGTRDDLISEPPNRIEELVAKADQGVFFFTENSIFATYREPLDRAALFGPRSFLTRYTLPLVLANIHINNVRVHWPKLVEALQEAGFEISTERPKPAAPRGATKRATVNAFPRPKLSDRELREWYKARVNECTERGEHPSEATDWQAARERFEDKVRRYQIRDIRHELAPADWHKQGRRAKLAPIEATRNSAE